MTAPCPKDVELAQQGAQAAVERLKEIRTQREDGDDSPGRIAAVDTLCWVRLLAEQLGFPQETWEPLRGDGNDQDESDLVNAMRPLRNTATHKLPAVSHQGHAPMWLGISAIVGVSKVGGDVVLCWIPTDELRHAAPKVNAEVYEEYLAGQPAYTSSHRTARWLTRSAPKFRDGGTPISPASR